MTAPTVKVAANQRLSRTTKLCQILVWPNDIADTSDRVDQLLRKSPVHFRAKPVYQDIDHVGLRIETEIPNVFQNHRLGDRASGMTQQQFEQSKFTGLQLNFLSGANNFPGEQVHFKIINRQVARLRRVSRASDKRLNPRQQLREGERFCQVIVASGRQPEYPILYAGARAEYQYGQRNFLLTELAQDRKAVQAGQHQIKHCRVVGDRQPKVERLLAILCAVNRKSTLFETVHHEGRDFVVIFDNQDAHRRDKSITDFAGYRMTVCKCHSLLGSSLSAFRSQV